MSFVIAYKMETSNQYLKKSLVSLDYPKKLKSEKQCHFVMTLEAILTISTLEVASCHYWLSDSIIPFIYI